MSIDLTTMEFQLVADRKGLVERRGKLTYDREREADLPIVPTYFRPMYGSYYRVAQEAVRRNDTQARSGFLDYLWSVEPKGAKPIPRKP